jgi:hypothetical protein
MRHSSRLDVLPALLLLLGVTAALAVQALRPRPGAAVFAVMAPGQVAALPGEWRLLRVVTAWPLATLALDRTGGWSAAELAELRATAGVALLFSFPAGADCLVPPR